MPQPVRDAQQEKRVVLARARARLVSLASMPARVAGRVCLALEASTRHLAAVAVLRAPRLVLLDYTSSDHAVEAATGKVRSFCCYHNS